MADTTIYQFLIDLLKKVRQRVQCKGKECYLVIVDTVHVSFLVVDSRTFMYLNVASTYLIRLVCDVYVCVRGVGGSIFEMTVPLNTRLSVPSALLEERREGRREREKVSLLTLAPRPVLAELKE